jgi:hypothetical protein
VLLIKIIQYLALLILLVVEHSYFSIYSGVVFERMMKFVSGFTLNYFFSLHLAMPETKPPGIGRCPRGRHH